MAITLVQNTGAVSNSVAYGSNNTAGNLLVMVAGTSAAVTAVSDTQGNTWVKAVENLGNSAMSISIWYAKNCAGGANTVTNTNGFGGSFCHIVVFEFSGCDTASPLDQTNNTSNTTGNPDSGNITTTQADEVLIGGIFNNGSKTETWGGSFTEVYDDASAGASRATSAAYRIVSATGTYSAGATISATADWNCCVASFKQAAGGGGGKAIVIPSRRWYFWRRK